MDLSYAVVALASVGAGIIQSVTGFGAGIFLMLFIPYFFDMVTAPALSSAICLGLSVSLAWKFRKKIQWSTCLLPVAVYTVCSVVTIRVVKSLDLDMVTMAFGLFLVVLSLYFLAFSNRVAFRPTGKSALVCSVISGVCSGLFGIGGPLMAIYFVSAIPDKQGYIGTIQFLFAATGVINLVTRMISGIYTPALLPITVLGFLGINIGKMMGLKILHLLDGERMKKLVYAFVGLSGVMTIVNQII